MTNLSLFVYLGTLSSCYLYYEVKSDKVAEIVENKGVVIMTVDEGIAELTKFSRDGKGSANLVIQEYDLPEWIERYTDVREVEDFQFDEKQKEVIIR